MNALTLAILALLSLSPGVYAPALRGHELGAQARAAQLAHHLDEAARVAHVDVALLTALAFHESGLDHAAVSHRGALGMLQLNPRAPWGSAYVRECRRSPDACELLNARWGAWALRDALQSCGSTVRALGAYRTGRCVAGPRAHATQRLAWAIRWRLSNPSHRPLTAGRLP